MLRFPIRKNRSIPRFEPYVLFTFMNPQRNFATRVNHSNTLTTVPLVNNRKPSKQSINLSSLYRNNNVQKFSFFSTSSSPSSSPLSTTANVVKKNTGSTGSTNPETTTVTKPTSAAEETMMDYIPGEENYIIPSTRYHTPFDIRTLEGGSGTESLDKDINTKLVEGSTVPSKGYENNTLVVPPTRYRGDKNTEEEEEIVKPLSDRSSDKNPINYVSYPDTEEVSNYNPSDSMDRLYRKKLYREKHRTNPLMHSENLLLDHEVTKHYVTQKKDDPYDEAPFGTSQSNHPIHYDNSNGDSIVLRTVAVLREPIASSSSSSPSSPSIVSQHRHPEARDFMARSTHQSQFEAYRDGKESIVYPPTDKTGSLLPSQEDRYGGGEHGPRLRGNSLFLHQGDVHIPDYHDTVEKETKSNIVNINTDDRTVTSSSTLVSSVPAEETASYYLRQTGISLMNALKAFGQFTNIGADMVWQKLQRVSKNEPFDSSPNEQQQNGRSQSSSTPFRRQFHTDTTTVPSSIVVSENVIPPTLAILQPDILDENGTETMNPSTNDTRNIAPLPISSSSSLSTALPSEIIPDQIINKSIGSMMDDMIRSNRNLAVGWTDLSDQDIYNLYDIDQVGTTAIYPASRGNENTIDNNDEEDKEGFNGSSSSNDTPTTK